MARTKPRRLRAAPRGSAPALPDVASLRRALVRPEVIGTVLVVLAATAIPYVLPLTGVIGAGRDALVALLGLHVFTAIGTLAGGGAILALRRGYVLRRHLRHLLGLSVILVFIAGLLGRWYPPTRVGEVDLAEVSAGGAAGRALTAGGWPASLWLSMLAIGFVLLWPRTALGIARDAPRATWALLTWLWSLRLDRLVVRAAVATPALVRRLNRRADAPRPLPDAPIETVEGVPGGSPALAAAVDAAIEAAIDAGPRTSDPREAEARRAAQLGMDLETPVGEWRQAADGWQLPPLKLLKQVEARKKSVGDNQRRAQLIVDTLDSFGVDATVVEINEGPTITQFGVEPGWDVRTRAIAERDAAGRVLLDEDGTPRQNDVEVSRTRIRVNRITALQNDLALALATPALRIEAPVPGKAMVGIEVPNGSTSIVSLRSIMEAPQYQTFAKTAALPLALGAGVSGAPVTADLARMPHLLIAGATGSGKSVCLNTIIVSLLMNYSPEQLRFVMIDPKRVELTGFGAIPHLAFSEIVVEMDRVVGTLQAVINEMESRYRRFAQAGVRNIERYNERTEGRGLPYWVVVIDELADLMLAAPYQVEHQLVRLAQLARATGIHLVVATQRPSVDVITGLIKANFPTRIAFAVSSQVDSRTILDHGGAEKLLGKGDMLYVPPEMQKPLRVQGVYVSDEEIEAVVKFWTSGRFEKLKPEKYDNELEQAMTQAEQLAADGSPVATGDDPMLDKAVEVARESRTLSTSMLQRKLGIGYPRAARVMDLLEERGVIGPAEAGGKSRDVLIDREGEPIGGAIAAPASLAAHAAAIAPRSAAQSAPPKPFDAE